jgi:hypothetical protein
VLVNAQIAVILCELPAGTVFTAVLHQVGMRQDIMKQDLFTSAHPIRWDWLKLAHAKSLQTEKNL